MDDSPPTPQDTPPAQRLDPRFVQLGRTVGWIVAGVVTVLLAFGLLILAIAADSALVVGGTAVAAVGVVAALVWAAERWPGLEYAHASYRIDDRGIEIHWGVVWRRVINVPRSRIQHTDVSQGPIERRYGLGTLVIYTAGTDHAQVDLPGLAHGTALEIRDHLLPRGMADAV